MIIRLKNADFSENNIGQVTIILEDTKNIMEAFGWKTSDANFNRYAKAMQKFKEELNKAGLLSKIKALYLPFYAKESEKAFVNLAKTPYETSMEASNLDISNFGAVPKDNTTSIIPGKDLEGIAQNNFHYLFFPTENFTKEKYSCGVYSTKTNMGLIYSVGYDANGPSNSNYKLNSVNAVWVKPETLSLYKIKGKNLTGYSFSPSSDYFTIYNPDQRNKVKGSIMDISNFSEWMGEPDATIFKKLSLSGYQNMGWKVRQSLFSFGTYLSESEIVEFDRIIKEMLKSLGWS